MTENEDNRSKFLLELYNQLWNSINARINVSWQSISILVSAFAIMALTEKKIISLNYSSSIIILLVFWYLEHIIDTSYWYNRNQAIISNIEREFLNKDDSTLIHPYFLSHRQNKMVKFLAIQSYLGFGIGLIVLALHYFSCISPFLGNNSKLLNFESFLPEIILVASAIILSFHISKRNKDYEKFIKDTPGKLYT